MTDEDAAVALIGMPGTGKSTYLAALYHLLGEQLMGATARLVTQPANRAYLEELHRAWLAGEPVGRTPPDNGELIELHVQFGAQEVLLGVPDIGGETFRDLIVHRTADTTVVEVVRNATGLLLFTHPDHVRPRVLIAEAKQLAQLLGEELTAEPADFDPLEIPGEVHLVDLLQWVQDTRRDQTPSRLAVVVSAWDRCGASAPDEWLDASMPMLAQFLAGHGDDFATQVYGACAQGGDYDVDTLADRRPNDRAYLIDGDGTRSSDLSLPARWAALG